MCIKLEVGKTYTSQNGYKYLILFRDGELFIGKREGSINYLPFEGNGANAESSFALIKEYREPVVHTHHLYWYKYLKGLPTTFSVTCHKEWTPDVESITILKHEVITYTEK